MPVHDWTRVPPGVFHDFHLAWMVEIHRCLNRGLLPDSHYALLELAAGPDADTTAPSEQEGELLAARRRRVMVRRSADDERVSSLHQRAAGGDVSRRVRRRAAALEAGDRRGRISYRCAGARRCGRSGCPVARVSNHYRPGLSGNKVVWEA